MRWLIDKSALVKLPLSPRLDHWSREIEASRVHLCYITALEVGYSARNEQDHRSLFGNDPINRMRLVQSGEAAQSRALEVQRMLAARGLHRAPSIPDLLVAATAEEQSFTVLHEDKDVDLISQVTGQRTERLSEVG